jgi:HNH endonuclease
MAVEALLSARRNRSHLKKRVLRLGLKEERCEHCGISEWRGLKLGLALHHVNGDGADNRIENLQLLCPNCHSQTETFAGRNRARRNGRSATTRRGRDRLDLAQVRVDVA